MNNEQYNQIVDEVYEKYKSNTPEQHVVGSDSDLMRQSMIYKNKLCHLSGYPIFERLSKEEFINKCKTDSEFSEKWGLKIEERKLSLENRISKFAERDLDFSEFRRGGNYGRLIPKERTLEILNKHNIPTKLIIITYKDETIEVYE